MMAVYDNPRTQARELWRDGVLLAVVTAEALRYCQDISKVMPSYLDPSPFVEDRLLGNPKALERPE